MASLGPGGISCQVFAQSHILRAKATVGAVLLLALFATSLNAGAQTNLAEERYSIDDNFTRGWHETTFGVGAMLSPGFFSPKHRPTVNYVSGFAQAGYMLYKVRGESSWRGNVEFSQELFGAGIWGDSGNYIAGTTLWARYNFVPRNLSLTPYLQMGGGVTVTDIDHRYDGQDFNFNLGMAIGIRYFVNPRLSLNAEYRYQHISNANTGSRNIGINATGPAFGVSWFF
jgi:opacity protein-like surface antigen